MKGKKSVKLAVVGIGNRGIGLLSVLLGMPDVDVIAICDKRDDKLEAARAKVRDKGIDESEIIFTKDFKEILAMKSVEAVVNATSWAAHINIAVDAMEAGKDVSIEVGGAHTIHDCWRLVETQEKTGKRCMMLENCCYGRKELAILNMVRKGMFGKIVHCTGGYGHDLRHLLSGMPYDGRERVLDYIYRNCENYPTHALGPIAKILDINRGNRMISLTSTASVAAGMEYYVNNVCQEDHILKGKKYTQGDIITTTIKCALGETITLTLDTTLPRPYSRYLSVRGTKGMYQEDGHYVFLDGIHPHGDNDKASSLYGNADKYIEENEHPIWMENLGIINSKTPKELQGGHGSMDKLVLRAFVDSVKLDLPAPIDVYDCASWMAVTILSEDSIACGGAPVAIPDFTNGKWMLRKSEASEEWGK